MTISPYQVDSILRAYSKQNKIKPQQPSTATEAAKGNPYADVVSLSSEGGKTEAFNKISYNLLDIIIKGDK